MYAIKKILVPIDLSETSLNAVRTATDIAKRLGAILVLLHVKDHSLDFAGLEYVAEDHSNDVVQALASSIQFKYGVDPVVCIKEGPVASVVLEEAFLGNYDLIIIGTHGASGYRECFIGSHTYQIIKFAHCPVLTVPPQRKPNVFKQVLFPVRMVTGSLMRYDVVRNFLTPGTSSVHVLGLSSYRQEKEPEIMKDITREVMDRMNKDQIRSQTYWKNSYAISDDILSYAQLEGTDMIVVTAALDVTHKPCFIGPNVQKIVSYSKVPVLCIRKHRVPSLS